MPAAHTNGDAITWRISATDLVFEYPLGTIAGIAVLFVAGRNTEGRARIVLNPDRSAQYQAPGSATFGLRTTIAVDGQYILQDGEDTDKFVRIQVWVDKLPPLAASAVVAVQVASDNSVAGANVTAANASSGEITSWPVTMRNDSTKGAHHITIWIDPSITGFEVSPDNAVWTAPTTEATGIAMGDLAAGASKDVYVRRTITAGAAANIALPAIFQASFASAL